MKSEMFRNLILFGQEEQGILFSAIRISRDIKEQPHKIINPSFFII